MGGNPFLFVTSPLVVVFKVNLQRVLAQPGESDAVVSGQRPPPRASVCLADNESENPKCSCPGGASPGRAIAGYARISRSDRRRCGESCRRIKAPQVLYAGSCRSRLECKLYDLRCQPNSCLVGRACPKLPPYNNGFLIPDRKSTRLNSSHANISYA